MIHVQQQHQQGTINPTYNIRCYTYSSRHGPHQATHRVQWYFFAWQVLYSEQELEDAANAAREGAMYFKGLDWENASGKWGHVATPWQDHYPNCWEDLAKVRILRNFIFFG